MSYDADALIKALLPYVVGVGIVTAWGMRWLAQNRRREQDFQWFAGRHPDCVRQGRVVCPYCRGARIHARSLLQHTYMREHFCVTCGHTLYYSPEDGR